MNPDPIGQHNRAEPGKPCRCGGAGTRAACVCSPDLKPDILHGNSPKSRTAARFFRQPPVSTHIKPIYYTTKILPHQLFREIFPIIFVEIFDVFHTFIQHNHQKRAKFPRFQPFLTLKGAADGPFSDAFPIPGDHRRPGQGQKTQFSSIFIY